MPARRIVARPPASQATRSRARGRLSPTNGSVTRADIRAIKAEFDADGGGTADEVIAYLLGAIIDWSPDPRQRARMSRAAAAREATRRQRRASNQLAQPPIRGLATT